MAAPPWGAAARLIWLSLGTWRELPSASGTHRRRHVPYMCIVDTKEDYCIPTTHPSLSFPIRSFYPAFKPISSYHSMGTNYIKIILNTAEPTAGGTSQPSHPKLGFQRSTKQKGRKDKSIASLTPFLLLLEPG